MGIERVIKPEIDYKTAFKIDYFYDEKWKKVDFSPYTRFLSKKDRENLQIVKRTYITYDKKTLIRIYVDKKDDVWYYSPSLFAGVENNPKNLINLKGEHPADNGKPIYWKVGGWSRIQGIIPLLKQGYSPIEVKCALALYVLDKERMLSSKYEDILLTVTTAIKEYLIGGTKC